MRFHFKYPLLFSLVMILGMLIGFNLTNTVSSTTRIPNDLFDTIEKHYLVNINKDSLQFIAISKALALLDDQSQIQKIDNKKSDKPHSHFLTVTSNIVDSVTGYIKIIKFSTNTYSVFAKQLDLLIQKGVKKITLDLRDTDGSDYNSAIQIADEFLSGDKLITYTKGAHQDKKEYRARRIGLFETGELSVLINGQTKGPGEVICGSIKEWKRGKLFGQKTAGKGIILEKFLVDNKYEITIPVLRYYTPKDQCLNHLSAQNKSGGVSPDSSFF